MEEKMEELKWSPEEELRKFEDEFTKTLETKDYNIIRACFKSFMQEFIKSVKPKEIPNIVQFYETLSQDYVNLLESSKEYDVIIEVGQSPSKKAYKTHASVLCFRCPHLYKELTSSNNENAKVIRKPNLSSKVFDVIIKYLYSGFLELKEEPPVLFDALSAANEFKIAELVTCLESYFVEHHPHWLRTNFTRVHREVFRFQNLERLQEFCDNTIVNYPDLIFESKDFETLPENALVSILRRDDLRLEETKIWDYIIKWGKAQGQSFPVNIDQWKDAEFKRLQSNLHNCLPCIRFFHVPGEDVFEKLQPYKQIIDATIWSDLMKKFMTNKPIISKVLPPRVLIDSNVISGDQARMIVSWADKKTTPYQYLSECPFRLKLILRGSRDGFSAAEFWELCEGEENLVVVAKVNGVEEIVGGYNPIGWERSQSVRYTKTKESFIFSFKGEGTQDSTLSRAKNSSKAIYNHNKGAASYGPCFGTYDLIFNENFRDNTECYTTKGEYNKSIRSSRAKFSVEEYEIFQLIEKIPNAR